MERFGQFSTLKNDEIFDKAVHNFGKYDDDMI